MTRTCSILVLNYNGKSLLSRFLGSIHKAANKSRICKTEVVLVDNQSSDGSVEWTKTRYPSINILEAPQNHYLFSLNWAVKQIDSEVIVLLNNDIEMTEDCLDPLFDVLLQDSQVFSVTPQLLGMDRVTPNGGHYTGQFHRGMLVNQLTNQRDAPRPTVFSSGGAMAVRREDFLALGGFDELYYPAYWEDVDLSYRAWKQGNKSIFQPASTMYHVQSASWKSDSNKQSQLSKISFRNCWLLTWRNISDRRVLSSNIYWTARHYLSSRRLRNKSIYQMYHEAFSRWREAIVARRKDEALRVWSDNDVLQYICDGTVIEE